MNKVFLSHKNEDSALAKNVYTILRRHGVNCYLDILDGDLEGDGERLTRHLRERLSNCTHLLAVLSHSTRLSWWVPFEIGLATEKEYPISSYLSVNTTYDIPAYLRNWPVLRNEGQIITYANMILKGQDQVLTESLNKSINADSRPKNYAEAFHKELKKDLGQ